MSNDRNIPSLCSCTADEASKYLLDCRFQGNATEVASFLLQAMDKLPNLEEINKALVVAEEGTEESDGASVSPADSLGLPIEKLPQTGSETAAESSSAITISATSPRSKFTLNLYENGFTLTTIKDEKITVSSNKVEHVIMFPKREDCLKAPKKRKDSTTEVTLPGSMVLIVLKEAATFRKKELTQICFQLPQHNSDPISDDEELHEHNFVDSFEAKWEKLFQTSFDVKAVIRVYNPKIHKVIQSYHFQSDQGDTNTSIMQGGMPYVKCYSGVNDGVLFPLEEGLLFFKPPKFIPRANLHSISCGRGSGGSRYVDLVATLNSTSNDEINDSLEFTNIDREELQCLNDYIHNVLVKAMAKDANDEDGEVSDASIDDVVTNTQSRKRKYQRAASVDARKATKVQMQSTPSTDHSEDDDDDFTEDDSEEENESDLECESDDKDSDAVVESDTESEEEE